MAATVRLSHDHTVTLSALEVLRLITDRIERDEATDPEDVEFVLNYFGEVSQKYPDNTLSQLLAELDKCYRTGQCSGFVTISRQYSDSVWRVLESDPEDQPINSVRPTLRRLEVKYVAPHCI